MEENYGIIIYWDVRNNCFVAQCSELFCEAKGETRSEAFSRLEEEIQDWHATRLSIQGSKASSFQPAMRQRDDYQTGVVLNPTNPAQDTNLQKSVFKTNGSRMTAWVSQEPLVVHVEGEIDIYTVSTLKTVLDNAVHAGMNHLIVDFLGVYYMDSSGLGTLLTIVKKMRSFSKDNLLFLVVTNPDILRLFQITRLNTLIPCCDSIEEAVEKQTLAFAQK